MFGGAVVYGVVFAVVVVVFIFIFEFNLLGVVYNLLLPTVGSKIALLLSKLTTTAFFFFVIFFILGLGLRPGLAFTFGEVVDLLSSFLGVIFGGVLTLEVEVFVFFWVVLVGDVVLIFDLDFDGLLLLLGIGRIGKIKFDAAVLVLVLVFVLILVFLLAIIGEVE